MKLTKTQQVTAVFSLFVCWTEHGWKAAAIIYKRVVWTPRGLCKRDKRGEKNKKTRHPATTPWDMYKHVLCTRIGCIRWKKWEHYVCRTSKHNSEMRMGEQRRLVCRHRFTERYAQWYSVPVKFAAGYISCRQDMGNRQCNFVYTGHHIHAIYGPKANGMAMQCNRNQIKETRKVFLFLFKQMYAAVNQQLEIL